MPKTNSSLAILEEEATSETVKELFTVRFQSLAGHLNQIRLLIKRRARRSYWLRAATRPINLRTVNIQTLIFVSINPTISFVKVSPQTLVTRNIKSRNPIELIASRMCSFSLISIIWISKTRFKKQTRK
jgi:hypothetical protein